MAEDLRISVAFDKIDRALADVRRLDKTVSQGFDKIGGKVGGLRGSFNDFRAELPRVAIATAALINPVLQAGSAIDIIGQSISDSIRVFAEFEKQVSKTGSIVTAGKSAEFTAVAYKKLEKNARDLGKTSAFSAQEVAEAQEFLARAGFTTGQILDATGATLDLAASASIELGDAADIASNILSQFGKQASELTSVVDLLTKTTSTSNTDVLGLAESFKSLGPTAAALNVELSETAAIVGILGNSGIQGSLAGTALGSSLTRLAEPTEDVRKELDRLNISFFDSQGRFIGLANTIGELEKALKGASEQQKIATINTIFGAEAFQEISTLFNSGSQAIKEYTEELENSAGVAAEVAEKRLDNLAGSVTKLQSAFQELQISVGGSSGFFRNVVDRITNLTQGISQAVQGSDTFLEFIQDFDIAFRGFGDLNQNVAELIEKQQIARQGFEGLLLSVTKFSEEFSISPELVSLGELEDITRRARIAAQEGAISYNEYDVILTQVDAISKVFANTQKAVIEETEVLTEQVSFASGSLADLKAQLSELNKQISQTNPNSTVFATLVQQAGALESRIDSIKAKIEQIKNPLAGFQGITGIEVPGVSLPQVNISDIFNSGEAGQFALDTLDAFEPLSLAAQKLGVDLDFAFNQFSNIGELSDSIGSNMFKLAQSFGLGTQESLRFSQGMKEMGVVARQQVASVAANAFVTFGEQVGKALATGTNAAGAFEGLVKSLVASVLVEVPKLIGMFLMQTGVALGFPAGLPFILGGAALTATSGFLGGLLGASSGTQQVPSGPALTGPSAGGLIGGLGTQGQAQNLIENNITILLESDGIVQEVRGQIVRDEQNRNGI